MKTFVLDGSRFHDLDSFYEHAGQVLCPDFNWGRNLDAFNDILRGGFGTFDYPETIELVWKDSAKSKKDLGGAETIRWLEDRMDKIHPSNRETLMRRLAEVRVGEGLTLYEVLVEIIRAHAHIQFREE